MADLVTSIETATLKLKRVRAAGNNKGGRGRGRGGRGRGGRGGRGRDSGRGPARRVEAAGSF